MTRTQMHQIGGVILTILFYILTFQAYQMIGRFFLSLFITLGCAVIWEFARYFIYKYKPDWNDVKAAMIYAVPTAVACVIIHFVIIGKFI